MLPYKSFREFQIPKGANIEFFIDAADYTPKEGDVFISSYPKCGTTWVQHIVYLLMKNGEPANSISDVITAIPFPEQDGFPESEPIAYKYHLPFGLMPNSSKAFYIYVARNPKDACVSYFHFLKKLPGYQINRFDDFYEAFLQGELAYGNFQEHVAGWFRMRHLPNVLFVTYESLSRNRKATILKIATFLGLKEDETTIQKVLKYSSFDFMKKLAEEDAFMQKYLKKCTGLKGEPEEEPKMMRKGIVGDWKNHFSQEQSQRMSDWISGTDLDPELIQMWHTDMCL